MERDRMNNELKRVLGTWDVVLLFVTAIIGLRWISLAAAGGNTSILLWFLAMLLFFIPQSFAVAELTTRLPGEGGIYLWAKEAFGDFHGFITGWCYWTSNLVYFPNLLVYIAGISVFVAGDGYQAVGENKLYVLAISLAALWIVLIFNIIGLEFGRWVNNIGGFGTWAAGTILLIFGVVAVVKHGVANPMEAGTFFSGIATFDKLSFWAGICFAFSGLELASVLAGEVKDPRRTIPRAVLISGIIITILYILGTLALLVAIPESDINIISGFLQGIAAVGQRLGLGWTTNILAFLITLGGIGGLMAWFTSAARMAFVAGVDHYLPAGFSKLHPRFGSPYIAVLTQALIATVFIVMSFIGSSVKEAYLVLLDTTLLVYFVPYGYMFGAYILLRKKRVNEDQALRLPNHNGLAYFLGVCGILTTAIAMALSVVPPADSTNIFLYELKVVGGFLLILISGAGIYWTKNGKADRRKVV